MSDSWESITLSKAVISHDAKRKPVRAAERAPGPYPYWGASGVVAHVSDFIFDYPTLLISEDGENLRTRKTPISFLATGKYWVNNHAHVMTAREGYNLSFLAYAVSQADVSSFLTGSTQPKLTAANLARIALLCPPLAEQQRIAGVLGALDDLIETNKRLITTLLKTADATALEQTVSGYTTTFAEICSVSGGGTPSTKEDGYWGGDVMWATPTDMTALPSPFLFSTSRMITQSGLDACSSSLFPVGSILMTSRATIGCFAVNQVPVAVNQGFIVVEPRAAHDRWFLFHEMRRRVPEFLQRANGSTFLELSRGTFKALPIVWPDEQSRRDLHAKLSPLHEAAAALQAEIAQLVRTRDELLPLLLSGAVTVAEVAA
ncbi:MAG: hypothetical protein JW395_1302 [Nitrospira sp.]|nr:hypothetical protein [Nitrospira sp.]